MGALVAPHRSTARHTHLAGEADIGLRFETAHTRTLLAQRLEDHLVLGEQVELHRALLREERRVLHVGERVVDFGLHVARDARDGAHLRDGEEAEDVGEGICRGRSTCTCDG